MTTVVPKNIIGWMDLFVKTPDQKNPAASMTKVMTALLVLEYEPELSGKTVVPPEAVSPEYCYWMDTVPLEAGEEVAVRDLMNYLLIASGNEAGTMLAIYVAGDIPVFIDGMNEKAWELSMTSSHFADPHGFSEWNLVTCQDMLIFCREAMKKPTFREIVRATSGAMPISNMRNKPLRYTTSNSVLQPNYVSEYDGGFSQDILGIKTGWIGDESG